jgi:hypothetical protein
VAGLDPEGQRVFYYFIFHDESTSTPQVWYFDLDGEKPAKPERALSLEGEDDGIRSEKTGIGDAWRSFSKSLVPLPALTEFDLTLKVEADSAARDTLWPSKCYQVDLMLEVGRFSRTLDLVMYCNTITRVRGVYGIPGRDEVVAVLSYKGRTYGCEEVDLPVLLGGQEAMEARPASGHSGQTEGSTAVRLVAGGHIRAIPDPFAPVTWYRTTRSTAIQYSDHMVFDVEFYFGRTDDGRELVRLRSGHRATRSGNRALRPVRSDRIRLTDNAGHYFEMPTRYPYRQVFIDEAGIEVWSDIFLVPPWSWHRKEPGWLGFAESDTIHVLFRGPEPYEFDLTSEQVAAMKEMIEFYRKDQGGSER